MVSKTRVTFYIISIEVPELSWPLVLQQVVISCDIVKNMISHHPSSNNIQIPSLCNGNRIRD